MAKKYSYTFYGIFLCNCKPDEVIIKDEKVWTNISFLSEIGIICTECGLT